MAGVYSPPDQPFFTPFQDTEAALSRACPTEDSNGALCLTGDESDPNSQCYCFPFIDAATGVYNLGESQQFLWNDGQVHCESIGGTLAQIYSEAERNTILSKIAPYITVWIGLSRSAEIDGPEWDALPCPAPTEAQCPARVNLFHWGGHTWGTGTIPQTYQDWWIDNDMLYEPDNTYPSRDEYCVFMVGYGNAPPDHPGTWDDDLCYNPYGIVCSVPQIGGGPTPSPSPSPPVDTPSPSPPPAADTPSPPSSTPGSFESTDVASTTPGTTSFTADTGVWEIANCGANMWDVADSFRYVHDTATHAGDVTITATVLTQDLTNFPAMKSALVLRSNLTPGSPAVEVIAGQTWEAATTVSVQYRAIQDGTTVAFDIPALGLPFNPASLPVWLQIERTGATINASASLDGESWTVIYSFTPPDGSAVLGPVFAGMGVSSVTYGAECSPALAMATFNNVSVE
eukprot:jgi/Chlat1/4210/Chrsp27S04300